MMNSEKKIIDYHISRLQDRDADIRLRSVEDLAVVGDEDALNALKALYETETHENVRKAIKTAGRQIFMRLREQKE